MKQRCIAGKKTGVTLTSCKQILFATLSLLLFSGVSQAANPISVKVISKIESTFEQSYEQPSNFAVDSKGNVYILEDLKEKVLIYNKNGKFVSQFGNSTIKGIDLYQAYSIICDDYDLIHIFEPYQNMILIISNKGLLKKKIQLDFNDDLEHKITDIKFAYNNYFMVDNKNHTLYIFDTEGKKVKQIGKNGELKGEFKNPFSLTLDIEGKIYITDVLNSRVQTFATTGTHLSELGRFGFSDGGLFRPNGVAVDSNLNVYVSDAYLGVIYIFDAEGKYIAPLMEDGKVLQLKTPSRIRIHNDRLYVLEMLKSRISIFEILL